MADDLEAPSTNSSQLGVVVLSSPQIIFPSESELRRYIFQMGIHSMDFEFLSRRFDVPSLNCEVPHDLVYEDHGKFNPNIIRYLPLGNRVGKNKLDFMTYVNPGVLEHRKALHHILGNGDTKNPDASPEDHVRTGIDTFSAIRGNRKYMGRVTTLESIRAVFMKGRPPYYKTPPEYKIEEFDKVVERIKQEHLEEMPHFDYREFRKTCGFLPNFYGINESIYQAIIDRTRKAFEMATTGEYRRIWESQASLLV